MDHKVAYLDRMGLGVTRGGSFGFSRRIFVDLQACLWEGMGLILMIEGLLL